MKRITLLLILTAIKAMALAQVSGQLELGKTLKTDYKLPCFGISVMYKNKIFTGEAGMKTNWQEYYTLFHLNVGIESKGRFLIGVNGGGGLTMEIPQLDRRYDPITKEYTTITEGYDTNGKLRLYGNAKIGYRFLEIDNTGATVFGSCSYSWKLCWVSAGIRIGAFKKD